MGEFLDRLSFLQVLYRYATTHAFPFSIKSHTSSIGLFRVSSNGQSVTMLRNALGLIAQKVKFPWSKELTWHTIMHRHMHLYLWLKKMMWYLISCGNAMILKVWMIYITLLIWWTYVASIIWCFFFKRNLPLCFLLNCDDSVIWHRSRLWCSF